MAMFRGAAGRKPILQAALAVAVLAGALPGSAGAQAMEPALSVPTTKILAIGSFTAKATPQAWMPLVPEEMRQTARLYLAGKIDQWYVKTDQSGVVFLLNVATAEKAHAVLDHLPLGVAGLMSFQFIPLGPLSPLRTLLGRSAQ